MHHLNRIIFKNFKAFRSFSVSLRGFNTLVGPNNAGKSTIIVALRILSAALKKANSRKSELVDGPLGITCGYQVDLKDISVADENIFHNYDNSTPASVEFSFSSNNSLVLYFSETGSCKLVPNAKSKSQFTPASFRKEFDFSLAFVPILGPVEHQERLHEKESARLALYNFGAARNFRNIWYHYPEKFDEFKTLLAQTWPGMEIESVKLVPEYDGKPKLTMFCQEERIARELFWAGYGFQVWCQLLTHIVQGKDKTLFIIDEPDIYLHSDLQRQLISILRSLGPDIVLATHSTEIITEAEPDEIILVDKKKQNAQRTKDPAQLNLVFKALGSNLNPLLTQLAKTRRALFVEGQDFQILSRFASKLGYSQVSTRQSFAVIPVEGFNIDRIRSIKKGVEETLGTRILAGIVLDRDFRPIEQMLHIESEFKNEVEFVHIHRMKEIENYVLVPEAINRAAAARVKERDRRSGKVASQDGYNGDVQELLETHCKNSKSEVTSQFIHFRKQFFKERVNGRHETDITTEAIECFETEWTAHGGPISLVPGKEALTVVNSYLQSDYSVSLTPTVIIEAILPHEIHQEIRDLIERIDRFSKHNPPD